MNKFNKIWEIALPYQDKRDDEGHAETVTDYAIKLCEIEDANDNIVVPAAILHDIGWGQLSKEERYLIFNPDKTPEMEYQVRLRHQEEGVKLAEKILKKVDYPTKFIKPILEIISRHDTRKDFISKEDGAMRDADKLWRYSKTGFEADIRRNNLTFDVLYNKLLKSIEEENFFFFESAKKIARKELEARKNEFTNSNLV